MNISVIIPCFNSEKTIAATLESIEKQKFDGSYEVIIVDNLSTDGTLEVIERFENIKILSSDAKTVSNLRNIGSNKSKNEILVFLDSDCILPDSYFKNIQDLILESYAQVGSRLYDIPKDSSWVSKAWNYHLKSHAIFGEVRWLPTLVMAVPRDKFQSVNGFNEELTCSEDVDLSLRLSKLGKIFSSEKLVPIHLGEPKNLLEFFKKEVWHGIDSLKITLANFKDIKDFINLLIPLYYIVVFILGLFLSPVVLIFLLFPGILMSFLSSYRNKDYRYYLQLAIIYTAYGFARGVSLLLWRR